MTSKKMRLLIGLVIVALAAIIIQFVYSDGRVKHNHFALAPLMPAPPAKPQVNIPNLPAKHNVMLSQQLNNIHVEAWAVQIASLRNQQNALALRAKLQQQGFVAYIQQTKKQHEHEIYRVVVGPFIKQSQAKSIQDKLAKQFKMQGMLIIFDPVV